MPALGPNRVIKIIPDERKLIIQIQGTSTCDDKENQIAQLDSPFNVTNWCFGQDKIEVSWIPPLEPLCHNYTECNEWPHSTCNKDSRDGKQRCLCNKHYYWNNSTLNCTSGSSPLTHIFALSLVIIFLNVFIMTIFCFHQDHLFLCRFPLHVTKNIKNITHSNTCANSLKCGFRGMHGCFCLYIEKENSP